MIYILQYISCLCYTCLHWQPRDTSGPCNRDGGKISGYRNFGRATCLFLMEIEPVRWASSTVGVLLFFPTKLPIHLPAPISISHGLLSISPATCSSSHLPTADLAAIWIMESWPYPAVPRRRRPPCRWQPWQPCQRSSSTPAPRRAPPIPLHRLTSTPAPPQAPSPTHRHPRTCIVSSRHG
jgi:hypothetical protein